MRHLISLGLRCDVAFQLRMHSGNNVSHFFDWLGTPVTGLITIIKNDFDVFHPDHLTLIQNDKVPHFVRDKSTGVDFHHQFPIFDRNVQSNFLLFYSPFISKFRYLASRFKDYASTKPITFVRRDITEKFAIELEDTFFKRFPGADVNFLYLIHTQNHFKTPHGYTRYIDLSGADFGDPIPWARLLKEEGLVTTPYRLSTDEILGSNHDNHNLGSRTRFTEAQLLAAIEENPVHASYHSELARFYKTKGKWDKAEELINKALYLDPNNLRLVFEKLIIQLRGKRLPPLKAAHALKKLKGPEEPRELDREIAGALLEAKEYEEALVIAAASILQSPLDSYAYYQKAYCLFRLRRYRAAEMSIETAISLSSKIARYHHLHSQIFVNLGQLQAAITAEKHALQLGGGFDVLFFLGTLLVKANRYDEALDIYDKALPLSKNYSELVKERIAFLENELESPKPFQTSDSFELGTGKTAAVP